MKMLMTRHDLNNEIKEIKVKNIYLMSHGDVAGDPDFFKNVKDDFFKERILNHEIWVLFVKDYKNNHYICDTMFDNEMCTWFEDRKERKEKFKFLSTYTKFTKI